MFALDRQNYDYAMVSGPTTGYLWILARRPELPAGVHNDLIAKARASGFPVDELISVDHSDPTCRQGR